MVATTERIFDGHLRHYGMSHLLIALCLPEIQLGILKTYPQGKQTYYITLHCFRPSDFPTPNWE